MSNACDDEAYDPDEDLTDEEFDLIWNRGEPVEVVTGARVNVTPSNLTWEATGVNPGIRGQTTYAEFRAADGSDAIRGSFQITSDPAGLTTA